MKRIIDGLLGQAAQNRTSFHIPGHKGKPPVNFPSPDIFKLDTTEIYGTDNLYLPSGIIKHSQNAAAKLYGALGSIFLTGGVTAGVITAMAACLSAGDRALIARNCHMSVISGLIITGAAPVYISPVVTEHNIACGIDPKRVKDALQSEKDIRAVIITSPTYEGVTSDIESISEITKAAGAYLIIDAAHGAHFPFSNNFPSHPRGADMVICGLHKTLPVFGQSAILNIYNEKLLDKAAPALALTQTSSPSYLLMACIDLFFKNYSNGLYDFDSYTRALLDVRSSLARLRRIKLLNNDDISRLVFLFNTGSPKEFSNILRERYQTDIEAAFTHHAIAVSSVADSVCDLENLARAVTDIDANREFPFKGDKPIFDITKIPEMVYTPRAAKDMPYEYADIAKCAGKVAWDTVTPYPPGIAAICPGEAIDDDMALFLNNCAGNGADVYGLWDRRFLRVIA